MEKVLISLKVPAVQRTFDLFVPISLEIETLTHIIAGGVEELCGGHYVSSQKEVLVFYDPPLLPDPSCSLADYGARDGMVMALM